MHLAQMSQAERRLGSSLTACGYLVKGSGYLVKANGLMAGLDDLIGLFQPE